MLRFGGSTWKSVRKGVQEAYKDFQQAQAAATTTTAAAAAEEQQQPARSGLSKTSMSNWHPDLTTNEWIAPSDADTGSATTVYEVGNKATKKGSLEAIDANPWQDSAPRSTAEEVAMMKRMDGAKLVNGDSVMATTMEEDEKEEAKGGDPLGVGL